MADVQRPGRVGRDELDDHALAGPRRVAAEGVALLDDRGEAAGDERRVEPEVDEARARDLGITHVFTGVRDKLACLASLSAELGLGMDECSYMGDDLADLCLFDQVGLAVAPSNAVVANFIGPWFSTSKKSDERRWLSRFSSRVLTELRSMVASARKPPTSSVVTILPSNFSNCPRTLVIR